ncbi:hypothetical protein ATG66_0593 [Vibrio sp. ES.051]|uniref:hypothetical protein n=1 Tax=Vibrio sp. ES.051 TaxID=1761909 RepID=UPI000C00F3B3|nr:hypothetical protein [Vibrio sp. ES.051]PFG58063.1 hypothetical protein ATG66_0593 [Vibrio sp. ES.051]
MRYRLRTLLVLSLLLFSGCILASYTHEDGARKHYTSERLLKLTPQDLELALSDIHSFAYPSSWGSDSYYLHIKRDLLALVSCRRTSASDGVLSSSFKPNYFLLVAFLPPPLLALAWQTPPLPLNGYESFKSQRSLYRLSGRKEANLLYVFTHGREPSLSFNFIKPNEEKHGNVSMRGIEALMFT